MDLRDQFAVHIAAALVGALTDHQAIARRSYDLAEAMLAERDRRINADEERAIATESEGPPDAAHFEVHAALLDEPAPLDEDDEDAEPPYDPTWDLEPGGTKLDSARLTAAEMGRPGLARTLPEVEDGREARAG